MIKSNSELTFHNNTMRAKKSRHNTNSFSDERRHQFKAYSVQLKAGSMDASRVFFFDLRLALWPRVAEPQNK